MSEKLNMSPEKDQKSEVREGVHAAVSGAVEEIDKKAEDAKIKFRIGIADFLRKKLEAEAGEISGPDKMRLEIEYLKDILDHFETDSPNPAAARIIKEMLVAREREYDDFQSRV